MSPYFAGIVIAYIYFSITAAREYEDVSDLLCAMFLFPIPFKAMLWPVFTLLWVHKLVAESVNKHAQKDTKKFLASMTDEQFEAWLSCPTLTDKDRASMRRTRSSQHKISEIKV